MGPAPLSGHRRALLLALLGRDVSMLIYLVAMMAAATTTATKLGLTLRKTSSHRPSVTFNSTTLPLRLPPAIGITYISRFNLALCDLR